MLAADCLPLTTPVATRLVTGVAGLSAVVSLAVVVSWLTGYWHLASIGPRLIPVAPSTALLLAATNLALLGLVRAPHGPAARRFARWTAWAAIVAGAGTALRLWRPELVPWDALLVPDVPTVEGYRPGVMSPHAGGTFVLLGSALLCLLAPPRRLRPWETLGSALALLALGSALAAVTAALLGGALLAGGDFSSMAVLSAVLFGATAVALLAHANPHGWMLSALGSRPGGADRFHRALLFTFAAVVIGIVATGSFFFRRELAQLRDSQHHALASLARLKAIEIGAWRRDHQAHGVVLATTLFSRPVPTRTAGPPPGDAAIAPHVDTFLRQYGYDSVEWIGADESRVFGREGHGARTCPEVARVLESGLRPGEAVLTGAHPVRSDGPLGIAVVVAVAHAPPAGQAARVDGYVVLHSAPWRTVFDDFRVWPGSPESGRILLVQADDNRVRVVAGGSTSAPQDDVPAGSLVEELVAGPQGAAGDRGTGEGLDQSGRPVLAAAAAVAGTSWHVVVQVDRHDVYTALGSEVWTASISFVSTVLAAALGLTVVRRQRDAGVMVRELEERRLRAEAEQNYRTLFHEMQEGFALHEMVYDDQGAAVDYRFLAVNPAFERLTGLRADVVIGRTVLDVLPGTEPHWIATYGRVAATGEHVSFENYTATLDKHFLVTAFRPSPGRFACLFHDITERRRTQDLLIQTEKMISVGGLAAGMAHELNNPLGIIRQAVENAERRLLSDLTANREAARRAELSLESLWTYAEDREIPQFLADIRQAAGRASEIITGMLRFARRSDTSKAPTDVVALVERAIHLASNDQTLHAYCDLRDIGITRDYAPDLPSIVVVPTEIEQVLLNLLTNAGHAMADTASRRPPHLTLRVFVERETCVIQVRDNGPGLRPEVARRVFEPFFTTKRPGLGTGLGLSVAYAIVTQHHGGCLQVESAPGDGACFSVRLPIQDSPAGAGDVTGVTHA